MEMAERADILLIEDNPGDARLAQIALKQGKITTNVVWLKDGEEALEYLFAEGRYAQRNVKDLPKVVLMDLKLPKVNGFEVFQQIKNNPATADLQVVMITSSDEEKDIAKANKLGLTRYIVKPMGFLKYVEQLSQLKDLLV